MEHFGLRPKPEKHWRTQLHSRRRAAHPPHVACPVSAPARRRTGRQPARRLLNLGRAGPTPAYQRLERGDRRASGCRPGPSPDGVSRRGLQWAARGPPQQDRRPCRGSTEPPQVPVLSDASHPHRSVGGARSVGETPARKVRAGCPSGGDLPRPAMRLGTSEGGWAAVLGSIAGFWCSGRQSDLC